METLQFKETASRELFIDYYPTEKEKACLLFFHGGALLLGSRKDLPAALIEYLQAQGFSVAAADYRSVLECPVEEILSDIRDAVKTVKEKIEVKPLYTFGYSAGAYLCLLNAAVGETIDGCIAFAGYGDLKADWYHEPSEFFVNYKEVPWVEEKLSDRQFFDSIEKQIDLYVYLRQHGQWPMFALGKDELEQRMFTYSPIFHLKQSFPRTVLVHGSADNDVPASASLAMHQALKAKSLPSECVILKDFDHDAFIQIENREVAAAWQRALAFIHLEKRYRRNSNVKPTP